ncbi:hypothetical protein O3P69_016968 [Scylla paramamosain]|uniref:Uncharacterized protein n=1 Tax=Scylla paramamosain TaxID=85552 RepID=A0AAW0TTG1_SCYPA
MGCGGVQPEGGRGDDGHLFEVRQRGGKGGSISMRAGARVPAAHDKYEGCSPPCSTSLRARVKYVRVRRARQVATTQKVKTGRGRAAKCRPPPEDSVTKTPFWAPSVREDEPIPVSGTTSRNRAGTQTPKDAPHCSSFECGRGEPC